MEQTKLTGYPSIDRPWEKGKTYLQKHPFIPPVNIYTLIKLINRKNLDKSAITCHENTYTYGQMLDDSVRLAHAMALNKVKRGDIVAVCLPNIYEAVIVFLACNKVGAVFTCLNSNTSSSEICNYINLYNSPIIFTHRKDLVAPLFEQTAIKEIVMVGTNSEELPFSDQRAVHYAAFVREGKCNWRGGIKFNVNDDALILYTSGTTGKPKSVVLTNKNISAAFIYMNNSSDWAVHHIQRMLICVPFAYPYGFVTSLLSALAAKCTAILCPYMSGKLIPYYYSQKPDMVMGSPALLDLTIRNMPEDQDLSFVRFFISGGDFLTLNMYEKGKSFFMRHRSNVFIGNGSGNAETVSIATTPFGFRNRPETAGVVLTGTDAMIVDPVTFEEKKYGEEGLMLASGKYVFREYYGEPGQTKAAKKVIHGREYFITGTMGYLDEDGYFTLTGRQSRFYINASLNKIYLDHVQKIINNLDCVEACAAVKVPDEKELYVNKAYIVLKEGYRPCDEMKQTILQALNAPKMDEDSETLKSHEIPTYMEFLDRLPLMEGSEKVNYLALEERAAKERI